MGSHIGLIKFVHPELVEGLPSNFLMQHLDRLGVSDVINTVSVMGEGGDDETVRRF